MAKKATTNTSNDEPRVKRTRGPRKPKGPQLDAADYEVLLNHYDQAYTTARMDETVSNEELMAIYERLRKLRLLTAPEKSSAAQSPPFSDNPAGLE